MSGTSSSERLGGNGRQVHVFPRARVLVVPVGTVVVLALTLQMVSAWAGVRGSAYTLTKKVSSSSITFGQSFTVKGTVKPLAPGKRVNLQLRYSGAWHSVASGTLGATSRYKMVYISPASGSLKFRVFKPASRSHPEGQSASFLIEVDGGSDVTAPTIVSVTASPSTASPGDVITVSANVTDAETGVTAVGLQASLNGTTTPWCNSYASLASGTPQNGTWTMTCTVPNTANSGTYSIYPYASDAAGNWVNTNGGPSSSVRGTFTIV